MGLGEYLAGCLFLAGVLGGCGGAAALLVHRRLRWMVAEARAVAWALLTAAAIAFAHLLPLALTVLTRGTPVVVALLLLAAASRVRPDSATGAESAAGGPSGRWEWLLGGAVAALSAVFVVAYLRVNRAFAVSDIDSTSFHLPVVARWIETGSVWRMDDFVPGWGFGAYPQTGNLLQTAVVLPWRDDFLLRGVAPAFMALAALAVYALACELGAKRAPAVAFAAMAVLVPAMGLSGLNNGQTDSIMAATFMAGILFLARHARTGRSTDLLLAGLGLGLAFGIKWYGPPEIALILVIWFLAHARARRSITAPLREGLVLGATVVGVGGFWLLRNLVEAGNPIFPKQVEALGVTVFGGAASFSDGGRAVIAHISDVDVVRDIIWPQYADIFSLAGGVALLAVVVAFVLAVRGRAAVVAIVSLGGLLLVGLYSTLPLTSIGLEESPIVVAAARYAMPAILIAAACGAWVASRSALSGLLWQAAALAGLIHALTRYEQFAPSFGRVTAGGLVLVAVGLALAVVVVLAARSRVPAVALCVLLVLGAGAAGRKLQTEFDGSRYRGLGAPFEWIAERSGSGLRVGLAGSTVRDPHASPYLAFGPRLRNEVEYVGERRDHMLRMLGRESFLERLREGGYDLLLVGRIGDEWKEAEWARSAGWRDVAAEPMFVLLQPPR